jgi:cell wall-associated NlpC family hydrolase
MKNGALDPRLHAYRPDLADITLKGEVEAERFAEGERVQFIRPYTDLVKSPAADASRLTQALFGETATMFEAKDGFAWVQLEQDFYVGYVPVQNLSKKVSEATHRVATQSTWAFAKANLKTRPSMWMPLNARLPIDGEENGYAKLDRGGFIFANHVKPLGENAFGRDWVSVAEQFVGVPYLWGGKTTQGLDCSGLVQVSLEAFCIECPRDADMQEQAMGESLEKDVPLKRGDLVFWDGHVGIMQDNDTLLHANGFHMMTVSEPLAIAIDRIAAKGSRVTSIKRLQ